MYTFVDECQLLKDCISQKQAIITSDGKDYILILLLPCNASTTCILKERLGRKGHVKSVSILLGFLIPISRRLEQLPSIALIGSLCNT